MPWASFSLSHFRRSAWYSTGSKPGGPNVAVATAVPLVEDWPLRTLSIGPTNESRQRIGESQSSSMALAPSPLSSNALPAFVRRPDRRSEEHTSELQSHSDLVC